MRMEKKKPAAKIKKPKVISLHMDAAFFFERAVQSLDRFHYEKALKYFRRAVEYEPNNPVNHCNMAGVLSEIGSYEESNNILKRIIDEVDPGMTECHFYMANNYANMEEYESAEESLIQYLELDASGQFLEEAEEMIDLLSYELERPTPLKNVKCKEGLFEHDQARTMLEEGRFSEAALKLEKIIKKHPDLLAARNNLALAYYYMGNFDKCMKSIKEVLEVDSGNLHALCNLAIFYQHSGEDEELAKLLDMLGKTYPFQYEHLFKLAMTLGILGDHEAAYKHFKRLLKAGEINTDPSLYHYTAVAAYNTDRYKEAHQLWVKAQKHDPDSDIPKFYLSELRRVEDKPEQLLLSYHYHLPFEEQFRVLEKSIEGVHSEIKCDPLMRSSFVWALLHADNAVKLQVIQVLGMIGDSEVECVLRDFLLKEDEDEYLKKVAVFALRTMGAKDPINAVLEGKEMALYSSPLSPNLPVWKDEWQDIMDKAIEKMDKRYDMIQQHDLQTLWVEFLTRVYPDVPQINKGEGWSAALEYLTAKMHRRTISYREVADRYQISIATVRKNVNLIDEICGLREKMNAIFTQYSEKF
jgi:tetratricopeptide (TPR) repeat protein